MENVRVSESARGNVNTVGNNFTLEIVARRRLDRAVRAPDHLESEIRCHGASAGSRSGWVDSVTPRKRTVSLKADFLPLSLALPRADNKRWRGGLILQPG